MSNTLILLRLYHKEERPVFMLPERKNVCKANLCKSQVRFFLVIAWLSRQLAEVHPYYYQLKASFICILAASQPYQHNMKYQSKKSVLRCVLFLSTRHSLPSPLLLIGKQLTFAMTHSTETTVKYFTVLF